MLTGFITLTACFHKMSMTLLRKGLATGGNRVHSQGCWGTRREETLLREAPDKALSDSAPRVIPSQCKPHPSTPEPTMASHYLQSEVPTHSSESPVITPKLLPDLTSLYFLLWVAGACWYPPDTSRCIYIPPFPHFCVRHIWKLGVRRPADVSW